MATQLSGPVMPIKTVSLCILVKSHSVDKMLSQVQKCWEFAFFFFFKFHPSFIFSLFGIAAVR